MTFLYLFQGYQKGKKKTIDLEAFSSQFPLLLTPTSHKMLRRFRNTENSLFILSLFKFHWGFQVLQPKSDII